ncbi:hypothetical protein CCP3SC5AM1_1200002 [Gammaproteobacteria bacterium]
MVACLLSLAGSHALLHSARFTIVSEIPTALAGQGGKEAVLAGKTVNQKAGLSRLSTVTGLVTHTLRCGSTSPIAAQLQFDVLNLATNRFVLPLKVVCIRRFQSMELPPVCRQAEGSAPMVSLVLRCNVVRCFGLRLVNQALFN